ncbi:MAG: hypothetical protein JNJ83_00805 [Verrucomicrobiaceae bacterium]|nr:hypothetical protein [Verrucomicrobiaceae bacterium]
MNTITTNIKEVFETASPDVANTYMQNGWALLGVFQQATHMDGSPAAWPSYVLGMPDPTAAAHISEITTASVSQADGLLARGWEILRTYVSKDDDGSEYPCLLFGKRSTAPKPKFTGNGVH